MKWQMDVKYVSAACYSGKDGEKFYQYTMKMSRTVQSNLPKNFGKRVSGENHFLKGSLLTD